MAVVSSVIAGGVLAAAQGVFPGSRDLPRIAAAVGNAVAIWIRVPVNVVVQGVTTGLLGAGVVNGKLFVGDGVATVTSSLRRAGITGLTADGFGTAVGAGVASSLSASGQYLGAAIGVGVGVDASKVTFANAPTLIALLLQAFGAEGLTGPQVPQVATGLGNGIAALVLTGTGVGGVTGVPSPTPAVGTSIGAVV